MSESPEAQRYMAIAQHDCRVLGMLLHASTDEGPNESSTEDTTDWQVTLVYYVMCIQVKALGCCRGVELQDHYTIKQWLNTEADLLIIAKPYRKAEEWSRDARYEGRSFTYDEMTRYLDWFGKVYDHTAMLLENEGVSMPASADPRVLFSS